jgi:DNA (cytosine-5)-methyltransferase 1
MLTHFSLFTGIGGLDLSAEWAGFQTVGQCEWADYPTKVLEKHWPDVPRWRDIRSVTKQSVEDRGISAIDIISGGFPCQPFSVAGLKKGKDDDRYLWPEMCRVISELQPTWVFGENVANIVNMALDQVLSDLENINYTVQPFIIPACAVNSFDRRDRTFIIAHINSKLRKTHDYETKMGCKQSEAYSKKWAEFQFVVGGNYTFSFQEKDESKLCGDDDGVRNRLDEDRLKCLGNAVKPQQAYPIFQAIADIERGVT